LEQLNESKQKRETLEVLVEEKRDALEARIKELERMAREYPQLEGIFLLQAQSLTSTLDYLDQMVEVMTVDDPVGGGGAEPTIYTGACPSGGSSLVSMSPPSFGQPRSNDLMPFCGDHSLSVPRPRRLVRQGGSGGG